MLKNFKKLGFTPCYDKRTWGTNHLSVAIFADAARLSENAQPRMIDGLLFDDMNHGSIFHVLSWRSNLSKHPVMSTGSAEALAAGAALDDYLLISSSLSFILKIAIPTTLIVDSKDLFDCHIPEDR